MHLTDFYKSSFDLPHGVCPCSQGSLPKKNCLMQKVIATFCLFSTTADDQHFMLLLKKLRLATDQQASMAESKQMPAGAQLDLPSEHSTHKMKQFLGHKKQHQGFKFPQNTVVTRKAATTMMKRTMYESIQGLHSSIHFEISTQSYCRHCSPSF